MFSNSIDNDEYYQHIMNGGDAATWDFATSGSTYSGQLGSGGVFNSEDTSSTGGFNFEVTSDATDGGLNFEDTLDDGGGIQGGANEDDEFGELEVPEGGFGEAQSLEDIIGKGKDVGETISPEGQGMAGFELIATSELQGLRRAISTGSDENTSLINQVNAAPKAWPARFEHLPLEDPVRVEIDSMLVQATSNYDKLKANYDFVQAELRKASSTNGQLNTMIFNMRNAPNPLQSNLNDAIAERGQLEVMINNMRNAPNPLQEMLNEALNANGNLQNEINRLRSTPNPLQKNFHEALAANDTLQSRISALTSASNPLAGELSTKTQLVIDLQKEVQRLTTSEMEVKSQVEELETKLSRATQQMQELQCAIDNDTAANHTPADKHSELQTAEFKLNVATRKNKALEKEVKETRAGTERLLEAERNLDEMYALRAENQKLRRANFKMARDMKEEFNRLTEVNKRLVCKMNEPDRKIDNAECQLRLDDLRKKHRENMALEEEEEKRQKEQKQMQNQHLQVAPNHDVVVPGGWSDNATFADVASPSSADLLAAVSTNFKEKINRKVHTANKGYLHLKYTVKSLWNEWNSTIFWLFVAFCFFLWFAGKDLVADETTYAAEYMVEPQVESYSVSSYSKWSFAGVIAGIYALAAVFNYLKERRAATDIRQRQKLDREFQAMVQADEDARKQAEWDEEQEGRRQYQERSRQLPIDHIINGRRGIYYGSNRYV